MAKFDLTGKSMVWDEKEKQWVHKPVETLPYDGTDALGDFNRPGKSYKNPKPVGMDEGYNRHSSGAMREKIQSIRYDYMPARIVNEAYARVADFGAKKYDVDNWMKGLPQSQLAASLQRHLWAYMDGENEDAESGLSHIDHVLWNAVALAYHRHHNLEDDRFESRKASK